MDVLAAQPLYAPALWPLAQVGGGGGGGAGPGAAGDAAALVSPALVLALCVVAGVGTLLMLPSRREAVLRRMGAVILAAAGLILVAMLIHSVGGLSVGHMSVFFWLFSAVAVLGAIRVITHERPVYSALWFVLTVLATAGLFVLCWAEFMAAALVIIYAGAILVTYVFVIMLATHSSSSPSRDTADAVGALNEYDAVSREPLAACAIGFTLMGVLLFVIFDRAPAVVPPGVDTRASAAATAEQTGDNAPGSPKTLGRYLFKNQLVNLELAGLILTIGMVGAILIAKRQVVVPGRPAVQPEVLTGPATPIDDNPHSIPVTGTMNPRQKAYPES